VHSKHFLSVLALPTSARLTHLTFTCIENFLAVVDRYYNRASKGRWRQYLRSMIVRDETCFHHFEPESKQQACIASTLLSQIEEVQSSTIGGESNVYVVVGLGRANTLTL